MKQAIVTGGAGGLGADIATRLDAAGYRVGVLDLTAETVAATAGNLSNGIGLVADVRDPVSIEQALADFGETPDLFVNNAGIVRFGAFHEQSVSDLRDVLEVNLLGSCICAKQVAGAMIERGSGHIVNITSVNGVHPAPSIGTYGAAKAALQSLTQLWANEWGPHGIRVNAIAPGFIDAGMSKPIFENPKVREVRSGGVPLRAIGTADDISGALLFLDSDDAGYITGHELVVDGGVINSVLMHLPRE